MKKGITLIGIPGSGKSTVGQLLAKDTSLEFLDLDDLIRENIGISPNDYLKKYGDEALLVLEEKLTLEQNLINKVFSPGGSIIYSDKAMKKIKEETLVVYLKVRLDELKKRVKNLNTRAIVRLKKLGLEMLYSERVPMYEKSADIVVENTERTDYQIAHQILSKYS